MVTFFGFAFVGQTLLCQQSYKHAFIQRFPNPRAFAALLLALLPACLPAQSLWRDDTARSLIADRRARAVGDIVTIVV